MRILGFVICFFISASLYAKDYDYIGTRSNPIPLRTSGQSSELKTITIYLYQDKTFEMMDNNVLILNGTFEDNPNTISYSDHIAFSNKIYISKNGDKMICLQTILYKPDIYKLKSDWFCPQS